MHGSVGLVALRRDGFTDLQLAQRASAGQLTTVSLAVQDRRPLPLSLVLRFWFEGSGASSKLYGSGFAGTRERGTIHVDAMGGPSEIL